MNADAAPETTHQDPGDESRSEAVVDFNQSLRSLIQQARHSPADAAILDVARESIERANAVMNPFGHTGPLASPRSGAGEGRS